jgi:hypothetical protein
MIDIDRYSDGHEFLILASAVAHSSLMTSAVQAESQALAMQRHDLYAAARVFRERQAVWLTVVKQAAAAQV